MTAPHPSLAGPYKADTCIITVQELSDIQRGSDLGMNSGLPVPFHRH